MAVTEGQLISDGTVVWKVKKIGSEVPAGTMQMFAGNTIPAGWLLCDDLDECFDVASDFVLIVWRNLDDLDSRQDFFAFFLLFF